jgi:hypothetical protein
LQTNHLGLLVRTLKRISVVEHAHAPTQSSLFSYDSWNLAITACIPNMGATLMQVSPRMNLGPDFLQIYELRPSADYKC